ncbi:transcription termination/antitermination protein NusG [Methylocystis parvus]|uniref:transcription termination/antitermination protein NusG n=1 Tax=Methylocystis parvus TaxID=134 RepID=UPI003C73E2D4
MAWHVIECIEGKDKEAYGRLAALGFEVWRPTLKKRESTRWQGKPLEKRQRKPCYVPIFGRYLFIQVDMSDAIFGAVLEQPGVYSWLCYAGSDDPATVPDEWIAHYKQFKPECVDVMPTLAAGDKVGITQGPFAGLQGVVNRVDKRGVVCVQLDIFGRPTPLILPVGHVELVEQGHRPPIERDVEQRQRKRA